MAEKKPDLDRILDGRKLRFWVNPYGDRQGTRLMERIGESEVFLQARRAAMEEETRFYSTSVSRAPAICSFGRRQPENKPIGLIAFQTETTMRKCCNATIRIPNGKKPRFIPAGAAILCRRTLAYYPARLPEYAPDPSDMLFHAPHRAIWPSSTLFIDPSTEPPPNQAQEPPLEKPVSIAPWLEFSPEIAPQVPSRSPAIGFQRLGERKFDVR